MHKEIFDVHLPTPMMTVTVIVESSEITQVVRSA